MLYDREGASELATHIQTLIDRCLNTIEFRRRVSRATEMGEDEDEEEAEESEEQQERQIDEEGVTFRSRF